MSVMGARRRDRGAARRTPHAARRADASATCRHNTQCYKYIILIDERSQCPNFFEQNQCPFHVITDINSNVNFNIFI